MGQPAFVSDEISLGVGNVTIFDSDVHDPAHSTEETHSPVTSCGEMPELVREIFHRGERAFDHSGDRGCPCVLPKCVAVRCTKAAWAVLKFGTAPEEKLADGFNAQR